MRAWLLRRGGLRLVFVRGVVAACAEDLLEDVFLLLGGLGGVGRVAVGRGVGGDGDSLAGGVGLLRVGWQRGGVVVAADAEELLEEVLGGVVHLATGISGGGAVEEGCGEGVVGAGGVCEEVGGLVDAVVGDAVGWGEGFDVGVLGELDGAVHELGPDGSGGDGSGEFDVGVVVVADPDDADKVGVVGGEPCVVGGAGFARGGGHESTLADCVSVTEVHDAFKE